jgi:hypothetical protein
LWSVVVAQECEPDLVLTKKKVQCLTHTLVPKQAMHFNFSFMTKYV